jgi:hypothetical protein
MALVRVVSLSVHHVVGVAFVRHALVAAAGPVDVGFVVAADALGARGRVADRFSRRLLVSHALVKSKSCSARSRLGGEPLVEPSFTRAPADR